MTNKPFTDAEFAERFWERVDKTSDASGCWLWTGSKSRGYGHVRRRGKIAMAHSVAYFLTGHTVPDGLGLAHSELCVGKKHCCNPDHLTPKTPKENAADRWRDGTVTSAKLTETQVLAIRARAGELHKDLAREFNIDKTTISDILRKKTWKHI